MNSWQKNINDIHQRYISWLYHDIFNFKRKYHDIFLFFHIFFYIFKISTFIIIIIIIIYLFF